MILKVRDFSFSYSGRKVLKNLDFDLSRGEIVCILGPNGSGKSTFLKGVSGVLPQITKEHLEKVESEGRLFSSFSPWQRSRKIAYVPAEFEMAFPLSVIDFVAMGESPSEVPFFSFLKGRGSNKKSRDFVLKLMSRCFCESLYNRNVGDLSGGEKQRVLIARALAQGAKTLFLDESLSKMDLNYLQKIVKLLMELAAEGCSIVVVTHDLSVASILPDRLVFLKEGRIRSSGQVAKMMQPEELESIYPGVELSSEPSSSSPRLFWELKRRRV